MGLKVGVVIDVNGNLKSNDGLGAKYYITDEITEIRLNNGLYAKEIDNTNGSKKFNKGNVTVKYDTAEKIENKLNQISDEIIKKASTTVLGRIIVGDNLTVDNNGRVSANPPIDISGKFDKTGGNISGNVTITGLLTANDIFLTSDKRLKTNVMKINNSIDKIKKLNGYNFNWLNNGEKSGGVIAQELLPIVPEFVIENNGYYRVNYNGLIGLLIETNKELIKRIEELEGKVR